MGAVAVPCPRPGAPAPGAPGPAVGELEAFVRELAEGLPLDPREAPAPGGWRGPGRPRVVPALCLWLGLVVCVLRGFSQQAALWRLLRDGGLWAYPRYPVSDQAIYARLERDGTAPLERLFAQVSAALAARLAPYADAGLAPFAAAVVALDTITLDQIARWLPGLRGAPAGDARLVPGKLAGTLDLRVQQWRRVLPIWDARQNDKVSAPALVADLPPGSLVLADLQYFGFAWFDALTEADHSWVSRLRAKTSYTVLHVFYRREGTLDALVFLGAHRADRARRAVRLVQFRAGGAVHRYITNVLDPRRLPMAEVARLYARRWDFELAAKLAKRELGLHLLWSAKPGVIAQQVWAVLIIAQVLQALRVEVAGRAGAEPFEVSMPLLVAYLPRYAAAGQDPLAAFIERGRELRFIRPSRRTRADAPAIPPEHLALPPPDLALERTPRHAHRKCGPRGPTIC